VAVLGAKHYRHRTLASVGVAALFLFIRHGRAIETAIHSRSSVVVPIDAAYITSYFLTSIFNRSWDMVRAAYGGAVSRMSVKINTFLHQHSPIWPLGVFHLLTAVVLVSAADKASRASFGAL